MNLITELPLRPTTTGAGPAATAAKARRIPLRDRAWMPFHTVRAVGPIVTPTPDQVADLLRVLHRIRPDHPLLCRIDEHRGRLQPVAVGDLDDYLAAVVCAAPSGVSATGLTERLQARPLDGLPFRILLSDRAAAFRSAHVIGDTSTANPWFFGLLRAADRDRALSMLTTGRPSHRPLASALMRQFGRHPRRGVDAVRRLFPLGPAAAGTPTHATVDVPSQVAVTAAPAVDQALRAWRAEHAPSVSMASVWMAAAVRGLRRHGLDTGDGVFTMINCRRYLADGRQVDGNFAAGPYLTPDDLADPVSLGTELAAATADGVPLLLLTAIAVRSVARGGRPGVMPTTVGDHARSKINLSYFGRITGDDVDWLPEAEREAEYVVGAEPAGPDAITYVFAQSPHGMHLSATAYPEITDVEALRAAVSDVATDPVALLTDRP